MTCLDPNAVQEYLRGTAPDARRAGIDEHLDGCDDCRALVALAAQLGAELIPDTEAPDLVLGKGSRISRYVLGERIGGGSMGVVYAAEDPELQRKIAIKLLGPQGAGVSSADARLLREAQALARVSHPNVIPIFDVGTHDRHVFLAMELVDGGDLRSWLAARPRTVGEIVVAFTAAGRGLAAAHAAGLVHRDFKPDNVLVGSDGRVRVTDFGLARGQLEADTDLTSVPSGDLLAVDLTNPRALVGTPAYMAPEQLRGAPADAATDQFAFSVALYEALYGHRPFSARSLGELKRVVMAGQIRDEPRGRVPEALRRVLLRGLATTPAARFPSMDAFLMALARDHVRGARRVAAAALAALIGVGGALVGDGVVRARADGRTRADLRAAAQQLDHALLLRYQAFDYLAKPTSVLPLVREVTGNVDRAEFGLGERDADVRRLDELHENLASADWSMWTREGLIAIADYKGRLVYSTGAPRVFGTSLRRLEAVARAYDPDSLGLTAMVVRGDDPLVLESGLLAVARPGLVFVMARGDVPGGLSRAVFVLALDGRRLLEDLALGAGIRLTLVAPDASAEGDVPPAAVVRAVATPDAVAEVGGWIALAHPARAPDETAPIASLVVARPSDAGIEGQVAHGRLLLAGLGAALLGVALAAGFRAWRPERPTVMA